VRARILRLQARKYKERDNKRKRFNLFEKKKRSFVVKSFRISLFTRYTVEYIRTVLTNKKKKKRYLNPKGKTYYFARTHAAHVKFELKKKKKIEIL
jgi:hypothetical protein